MPSGAYSSHLDRDRLDFRVLLQRVLAHFASDSGLLEAAKRSCRVEDVEAVHPHRARPHVVRDGVRFSDIARPDRCRQTIGRVVRARPITSSMSWNFMMLITGPKISSRAIFISSCTSAKTVGSMK